ncbi:DUF2279 domain-containing protein [Pontibacter brevis]
MKAGSYFNIVYYLQNHSTPFFTAFILFVQFFPAAVFANATQADTLTADQKNIRQVGVTTGFAAGYATSLVLLHKAWYKHDPRSDFHFHNDIRYWNQVDKAGHLWTAFHQSRAGVDMLEWAGVPDRKAILYGSLAGILLQTPIEVFDGYGEAYGASLSDMGANMLGSVAVVAQHHLWKEIRIVPKFSFHRTPIELQRLEMLGKNYFEQMLKDYNGQTYWLSVDISAFLPQESTYPKWLNIAVGYGAEDMVVGNPLKNSMKGYDSYRQYYLSLDLNLMNIETRSGFLKKVFYVLSIFHLPAPALEFNRKKGLVLHPFYY